MPGSSAVETRARLSAYAEAGAAGRGRRRSRRGRVREPRGVARAAQARRLGRGDAVARGQSPPPHPRSRGTHSTVCSRPWLEARSPASWSAVRACRSSRCGGRPGRDALDEDEVSVGADRREHRVGHITNGDVDPGRDVDHLAGETVDVGRDDGLDRLGVVVDIEPVARGVAVAVDRQRLTRERLRDEARGSPSPDAVAARSC